MVNVIGRNIVWLVLNQLSTWAIALIVLIVVPDILDPAGFGVLNFALSYVAFFALVAGLGTSMYLVKEVARDHSIVGPWTYNAVIMKIVSVAVLSVVALVLAVALGNHGETLLLIAICCAGMLFSVVTEVLASALGGMERMVRAAIWLTVQVYFSAGVGILVVLLGWGVTAYAIVLAVATVIPMTACAIALWPLMREPPAHRSADLAAAHHRRSAPVGPRLVQHGLRHRRRADPQRHLGRRGRRVVLRRLPLGRDADLHRIRGGRRPSFRSSRPRAPR